MSYSDINMERETVEFYIPACFTSDPIINAAMDDAIRLAGGVTINRVAGKWIDPDSGATLREDIDIHKFITDDNLAKPTAIITERLYMLGEKVVLIAVTNALGQTTYGFCTEAKHV